MVRSPSPRACSLCENPRSPSLKGSKHVFSADPKSTILEQGRAEAWRGVIRGGTLRQGGKCACAHGPCLPLLAAAPGAVSSHSLAKKCLTSSLLEWATGRESRQAPAEAEPEPAPPASPVLWSPWSGAHQSFPGRKPGRARSLKSDLKRFEFQTAESAPLSFSAPASQVMGWGLRVSMAGLAGAEMAGMWGAGQVEKGVGRGV